MNKTEFEYKLDFIIATFNEKLNRQVVAYTDLVTKASYVFAFVSILLGGYVGVMFEDKINFACDIRFHILNILGILGLLTTFIFLTAATRIKKFYDPPDPETLYSNDALSKSFEDLKNQVASDMKDSYNKNVEPLTQFAKKLDWANLCFLVTLIIIIATVLFIPKCAIIGGMDSDQNNNTPVSQPVTHPSSQGATSPTVVPPNNPSGNVVEKGTVPPSATPGTILPFSEDSNILNFLK